jgi:hypothetical protein
LTYDSEEIERISNHFIFTVFSFAHLEYWQNKTPKHLNSETVMDLWQVNNYIYFFYQFEVGLSELYTIFSKKKDEKLLSCLRLTEKERKRLRNSRHTLIHVFKNKKENDVKFNLFENIFDWYFDLKVFERFISAYLKKYGEKRAVKVFYGSKVRLNAKFKEMGSELFIFDIE